MVANGQITSYNVIFIINKQYENSKFMIPISNDWILMKHIPLDSSRREDLNGGKIIAI